MPISNEFNSEVLKFYVNRLIATLVSVLRSSVFASVFDATFTSVNCSLQDRDDWTM